MASHASVPVSGGTQRSMSGTRAARHAVDPKQNELVEPEQQQHRERELRQRGIRAAEVEPLGQVDDDEQRERVLAEQRARQRVERDAHPKRRHQAEVPRRHQRPVQQHDGDPIRPQRRYRRPAAAPTASASVATRLETDAHQ